jgi:hypothetical protein
MIVLTLATPYGNYYEVHDNGDIARPGQKPSGQWKMIALVSVVRNRPAFVPLASITREWLDAHPLMFKNGKPRYTVRDLDHGTTREWGNARFHGVKAIYLR